MHNPCQTIRISTLGVLVFFIQQDHDSAVQISTNGRTIITQENITAALNIDPQRNTLTKSPGSLDAFPNLQILPRVSPPYPFPKSIRKTLSPAQGKAC